MFGDLPGLVVGLRNILTNVCPGLDSKRIERPSVFKGEGALTVHGKDHHRQVGDDRLQAA